MKMTNKGNLVIYRLWAPIYDVTVNRLFLPGRRRAMALLDPKPGEKILILGIGTGADLPLLPAGITVVGIDYSEEMLEKARHKLPLEQTTVQLLKGDAQKCLVEKGSFDAVILNLILSVIPDAGACLEAALSALKPKGRLIIFDKFLPDDQKISLLRKFINAFSTAFGTDINRRLLDITAGKNIKIIKNEPSLIKGTYRVILAVKND